MITNPFTGLLSTYDPSKGLTTSATKAVETATQKPTDANRLGLTAPAPQPALQTSNATATLQALNTSTATMAQTNQAQAQQAQQAQATATPAPAPEPTALQQTLQNILGLGTQLEGQGARSLEIQQEEDVFGKKARAKQLENEIMARSQSYEKQIREAMKNQGGGLRSGVQVDVNALQMRSAQEIADLSIAYKVASDDYAGAWEIAQAKIDAEFEPLKQRLETLKTYYQLAQNDMTESEKMQAEQKIAEQEKTLEFERNKQLADYKAGIDRENALYTQQLEQSDPLYQARLANERVNTQKTIQEMNAQTIGSGVAYTENGEQITATVPPKAPTVAEQNSLVFFTRMKESVDNLDNVEGDIRKLGIFGQAQLNMAPAWAQSKTQQLYAQATKQFTEARLRKDSGAAIPPEEFANDRRMYFPQPGDSEEVLQQKRKARNTTLGAVRQASGNAYWELYGQSPTQVSRQVQSEINELSELLKNASPEQKEALSKN